MFIVFMFICLIKGSSSIINSEFSSNWFTIKDENGLDTSIVFEGCRVTLHCRNASFILPNSKPFPSEWIKRDNKMESTWASFTISSNTSLGNYSCNFKDGRTKVFHLYYFILFEEISSNTLRQEVIFQFVLRTINDSPLQINTCRAVHFEQSVDWHSEFCIDHVGVTSRCGIFGIWSRKKEPGPLFFPHVAVSEVKMCNVSTDQESDYKKLYPLGSNWIANQHSGRCEINEHPEHVALMYTNFVIHLKFQDLFRICHRCSTNWTVTVVIKELDSGEVVVNERHNCKEGDFEIFEFNTSSIIKRENTKVNVVITDQPKVESDEIYVTQAAISKIFQTTQCFGDVPVKKLKCRLLTENFNMDHFQVTFKWSFNGKPLNVIISNVTTWSEIEAQGPGVYNCTSNVRYGQYKSSFMYGYPYNYQDTYSSTDTVEDDVNCTDGEAIRLERSTPQLIPEGEPPYSVHQVSQPTTDAAEISSKTDFFIHISVTLGVIIVAIVSTILAFWLIKLYQKKQRLSAIISNDPMVTTDSTTETNAKTSPRFKKKSKSGSTTMKL